MGNQNRNYVRYDGDRAEETCCLGEHPHQQNCQQYGDQRHHTRVQRVHQQQSQEGEGSEDLTQIRDVSPRFKPNKWRFQSQSRRSKSPSEVEPRCEHYICTPGAPCRMIAGSQSSPVSLDRGDRYRSSSRDSSSTAAASLRCSPQLQKVVYRAVNNNNNNNNYWRADRSNLSLSIRPSFV